MDLVTGPTPDDAMFLMEIAKAFDAIKVKPGGKAEASIREADEGGKFFHARAVRLRDIAGKIRASQP